MSAKRIAATLAFLLALIYPAAYAQQAPGQIPAPAAGQPAAPAPSQPAVGQGPASAPGKIDIDLQIIGFGVDEATKAQLEEAAKAGGGQYYAAENQQQLTDALGKATGLGSGSPTDSSARPAVMLVLDESNSMWGQIEGRAKIEIARESVRSLLQSWNTSADLGLVAYGHNRTSDCTDIETLRSVAPLDAGSFSTLVDNLTPRGKTPLTEAVRRAADELATTDRPASVILFSDGIETCGGDPCALAGELAKMGVNFSVHVIGFSVAADEKQLACLAEQTGGLYLTADNAPQLQQALQTVANRAATPAATDLITLEALDQTGKPITTGVIWTVTSLASEDTVPLTAGVSRPALPLAPGQYLAEATVGTTTGRTPFEAVAKQAQTVQVRLGIGATVQALICGEPNDSFAAAPPFDIARGIEDSISPQGDVDFCALDVPGAGLLTIAANAMPQPVDLVARVDDIDRRLVRDWTSALLPGTAPAEADLPEAGRYIIEMADSYSDATSPDPYSLALSFTPAIDATEPNNSLTRPAILPLGTPTDVAVFPRTEHNFLAVEVEEHGELTVTASGIPAAIDPALRLYGPDNAMLRDWQSTPAGVDNTFVVDLPGPGRYVIELADSYDDARSPAPLKLNAAFIASPDANEPNNTSVAATGLAFDVPTQLTILPRGDHDNFVLDAAHRGRLSIATTGVAGIEVAMRLLDSNLNVVRDWATAPAAGAPFTFDADLPTAGKYWLQVADAYDDGRSIQPVTLTATLTAAEDALEPNDRPRDAKPLALGTPVQTSILPRGDHDLYLLDTTAGPLTVRASQVPINIDVAMRLLDANLDVVANWTSSPAPGADGELKLEVPAGGRYWLEVADSYDDASAPDPFTLTATQP